MQILKNIDMPRQKPQMLHWQNLLNESLKMIMSLMIRYKILYIPHPRLLHYTVKKLFANALKIMRNRFVTLEPDNYLQFTKVDTRKSIDEYLRLYNIFVYALIYALIYLCTCVKERKTSLKFLL